jgi:hypothetical protein
MKRNKKDKINLLSTNNKNFINGGVKQRDSEKANDEPEQELEQEKREHSGRRGRATLTKKSPAKGVKFGDVAPLGGSVLEESPNDYALCSEAPKEPHEAESYYAIMLADFGKDAKLKEEVAMCKYSIAKIIMGEYYDTKENKLKNIERCITLLNEADAVLTLKKFPVTFAVINAMKAHLYRERALHLTSKDYVPNKGVAATQLTIGLKVAEEALGPLCSAYMGYGRDTRIVEQACLRLETGWLLLLKVSMPNVIIYLYHYVLISFYHILYSIYTDAIRLIY